VSDVPATGIVDAAETATRSASTSWAAIESSAPASRGDHAVATGGASHPLASSLRSRSVGTIVDEGGRIARRHGAVIFTVTSALLIPAGVAEIFAARAVRSRFLSGQNPLGSFRLAFTSTARNDAGALTAFIGLGLTSLAAMLVGAYVATIVAHDQLGAELDQRQAIRAFATHSPVVVTAWLITHIWVAFVFWAGQASGALAALVVVAALPFAVLSMYVAPAVILERLGPWRATRRSWQLVRQSFGTALGFFSLSSVIGLWFRFGLALFPSTIRRLVFTDRFNWLLEGLAAQLGIIIAAPIVACATIVSYLDVRTRTEGMDMVLECRRVFGDS
jgi:hypothetical protein